MRSLPDIRADWLRQLLSTALADRRRAEAAAARLYTAADFPEPRCFLWFDSPFRASWVVALLVAPHHQLWSRKLASGLSRNDKEQLERARDSLGTGLGISDRNAAVTAAGGPLGQHLQFPPVPSRMLTTKFFNARYSLSDDISSMFTQHGDEDDLARAEMYFWGSNRGALRSALHCPTTDQLIGSSFAEDYSFSTMADDEHRVSDRQAPAIMAAAWDVARSSGMWWPFEHVAIMSERPAEIHVNQKYLLHRADGPAVVYRDGWNAYAWNGKAVPEKWIMQPESVPPREYKGFDPTFAQHVKSKGAPPPKAKKRAKPASILETALPLDHALRLEQLRAHAGGKLPLYDRYQAGAHRDVWRELVSLGDAARDEPHVADVLAVAYETMRREMVGEVNLIGSHPTLAPADGPVATDPLVVYALDERAVEYDEDDDGEEGRPSAITIAPDDLHKANTSGGDPYEMAIPDPRADGELVNERHHLFFVDYLRLCFELGGFPGYDGARKPPAEIAGLKAGLIEF